MTVLHGTQHQRRVEFADRHPTLYRVTEMACLVFKHRIVSIDSDGDGWCDRCFCWVKGVRT